MFFSGNWIQDFILWIAYSQVELVATLSGLIYILYGIQGKPLLWFFGLVSSVMYVLVFFISKIYADMGLSVYYVLVSIYGWIHWTGKDSESKRTLPISKSKLTDLLVYLGIIVLLFFAIAYVLNNFTDSNIAYLDAFTTSSSVVATWMLARKKLENWLFWILIDLVSAGLYVYKALYPTALLFILYTILAMAGYKSWLKMYREQ